MEFEIKDKALYPGSRLVPTQYPIRVAVFKEEVIVVLLEPDSYIEKFGQFRNLIGLNEEGREIWVAELPTTTSGNCYIELVKK